MVVVTGLSIVILKGYTIQRGRSKDPMKPLNPNDEVYIKSLGMIGKVLRVRSADAREAEQDKFYEIQITQPSTALISKLLTHQTKRRGVREKVERAIESHGPVESKLVMEFLAAADDFSQELGHKPLATKVR